MVEKSLDIRPHIRYSENMTNEKSQAGRRKQPFVGVTLKQIELDRVDEIAAEKEWTRAQTVRHYFRRGFAEAEQEKAA